MDEISNFRFHVTLKGGIKKQNSGNLIIYILPKGNN